jgi:hypothetical protein
MRIAQRSRGISLPHLSGTVRREARKAFALLTFLLIAFSVLASIAGAQGKKTPAGEEFFMVASLDQSKSQLLLKLPTEVTLLAKVTPQTQFSDENGKPIKLSDLRAGDTVWAVTTGSGDNTTVTRLRKGPMSVADLHKYYLDYPEVK